MCGLRRLSRPASAGMTLIELLVVLLILAVVTAAVTAILANAWQSERTIVHQTDAQKSAQAAVNAIVDGLLGNQSGLPGQPYEYGLRGCTELQPGGAGTQSVTVVFRDDLGAITHTLTYRLSHPGEVLPQGGAPLTGRELVYVRQVAGSPAVMDVVCRDVSALQFSYGRLVFLAPTFEPVIEERGDVAGIENTIESLKVSVTVEIRWNAGEPVAALRQNYRATETSWVSFRNRV